MDSSSICLLRRSSSCCSISHWKRCYIEAKEKDNWTPLHYACYNDHRPIVQYLIEKGAHIEAKDKDQCTSLYYGCKHGHFQIVQYLIEKDADIEAKTKKSKDSSSFSSSNGKCSISHWKRIKIIEYETKMFRIWTHELDKWKLQMWTCFSSKMHLIL